MAFACTIPAVATLQQDDATVRITRWDFAPGAVTGWHEHGWPYFVVMLVAGTLRVHDGDRVTDSILEHRAELEETVEVLPLTLENLGNAVDDSGRLDVKLPPQYFSPGQEVSEPLCAAFPTVCEELGTSPSPIDIIRGLAGAAS